MDSHLQPFEHTLIQIVKQDVVPALGCTEPISLALASATAAKYLGHNNIERIEAKVSPNLMKNGLGFLFPVPEWWAYQLLPLLVPLEAMLIAV